MRWREEPLSALQIKRTLFDCNDGAMNRFFHHYARQHHDKGASKTFVAVDDHSISGFYTLSPASLAYGRTSKVLSKKLPTHDVPVFRLARIAVDKQYQGQGLGGQLLMAAGRRCLGVAQQTGGVALLIDAKSPEISRWYQRFGAIPLQDNPLTLVLPLATIQKALERA